MSYPRYLTLILLSVFLFACQPAQPRTQSITPEDVPSCKSVLFKAENNDLYFVDIDDLNYCRNTVTDQEALEKYYEELLTTLSGNKVVFYSNYSFSLSVMNGPDIESKEVEYYHTQFDQQGYEHQVKNTTHEITCGTLVFGANGKIKEFSCK